MKILALECSAKPASVALLDDEKLLACSFVNVNLTHSQTLMPMIESLLKASLTDINELEGICISSGPGSFTGIRIGISAVKGLAAPKNLPCVGVSTLEAIAQNYSDTDCIVCAVMDARCSQVYNALFDISNGEISRITPDRALLFDELKAELEKLSQNNNKSIIIVGDGADVFYPNVKAISLTLKADIKRKYQNATGVGFASLKYFKSSQAVSCENLLPYYLRLPQAERELKSKNKVVKK